MQFRVAVDEFLRFCALERQLSSHTVQAYGADLRDLGRWLGPESTLPEISTATLKAYLEQLVGVRKLTVSTVRRRFACLRAFFRWARSRGENTDPFGTWRPALPRRKRLPRSLSRMEASSLLARARKGLPSVEREAIFRTIIGLMMATGMRVGEVCKVRLEDLSPDASVLRIHGKGARDRIAYITDTTLRRELRDILEDKRKRPIHEGALFVNRYGVRMRPQSIRSSLRRLAKDAGIGRRVTPHMLRHTAATLLIETGVDIRFVQRLLGHSSIATTEIYTHVSDEALRLTLERADVLGALSAH